MHAHHTHIGQALTCNDDAPREQWSTRCSQAAIAGITPGLGVGDELRDRCGLRTIDQLSTNF